MCVSQTTFSKCVMQNYIQATGYTQASVIYHRTYFRIPFLLLCMLHILSWISTLCSAFGSVCFCRFFVLCDTRNSIHKIAEMKIQVYLWHMLLKAQSQLQGILLEQKFKCTMQVLCFTTIVFWGVLKLFLRRNNFIRVTVSGTNNWRLRDRS